MSESVPPASGFTAVTAPAFLDRAGQQPWGCRSPARISPFAFGLLASRIRETMTPGDPETRIERLFHGMYGWEPA